MWGMDLRQAILAHLLVFFMLYPVGLFCAGAFLTSRLSGWGRLARRFRASEPFAGESWSWQRARFRRWFGYNNCLTVGANQESFYLSILWPFRLFHPALLIPWREIEVEMGKAFFGLYETAQFRIGTQERVTVRIYGKLVSRVRQAAGPGWPLYRLEQIESQAKR
jgi:hypothetical protein